MFSLDVVSTCPVCNRNVRGTLLEEKNRIFLKKKCKDHGETVDLISTDAAMFLEKHDLLQPYGLCTCSLLRCLKGICKHHVEQRTSIAFVDITSRCNLNCPVCFADAKTHGRDVPLAELNRIIDYIKENEDFHLLILIGGEPTIHGEFIPLLEKIKAASLHRQTYISTNGVRLADREFCRKLFNMDIRRFAIGFDGTSEEIYRAIRGTATGYHAVRRALNNLRQLKRSKVILNVTAIKGVNDHDLPNIIRFGLENSDIVHRFLITLGTFCGRQAKPSDLVKERLTLEDIEHTLRKAAATKLCTFPSSLLYSFYRPFELLGLDFFKRFPRHRNPLCDHFAFMALTEEGKMISLLDGFLRRPEHIYRHGKNFDRLSTRITQSRDRIRKVLGKNVFSLALQKVWPALYYTPQLFFMLLRLLHPRLFAHAVAAPLTLRPKRYFTKKLRLKRSAKLWIIPCTDKFNFLWDKTRFCPQHYYISNPETGKVMKIPACSYLPFHQEFRRDVVDKVDEKPRSL